MPNPIDNEELYKSMVLGGVASPGFVTFSGHDRAVGWDVKEGNAQSGATTTLKSEPPIEFTATFHLLKDDGLGVDDFAEWETFQALIDSTVSGPTPKALDTYHPDLARNRIRSVVKKSVGGMIHDGKGGASVAVKFLEYKPAKPKGGTPKGSAAKKAKENDPNAEALAELAKLTKQYQDTPWG